MFQSCGTPEKDLTVLGRFPEFGSLHGMSTADVVAKFNNRSKASATDRAFLNRVVKGLGYASLSEITADKLTEVTVPYGTVGNMGSGAKHKTICARLNTAGKDLEAFRIQGANGCSIHFMKTCGNHFFFCEK